ncbi:MAG: hypothetical protein II151_01465 [Bacteroidales bacterium]|nr:hypothetical protein [Bacteroidales bacterium]
MHMKVFLLTSSLHNEDSVDHSSKAFLSSLGMDYELGKADFSDYGTGAPDLIYVRTGGTEGLFRNFFPSLGKGPFYLLTSGESNSLAASMEILSWLNAQGIKGEILHGSPSYVRKRIALLKEVASARSKLEGRRYGVIGKPSDWLISSQADYYEVRKRMGIELVDIPMERLVEKLDSIPEGGDVEEGAMRIYAALKDIVVEERLNGFTLRCFDLLDKVRNTGCLALAKLNAEGIVAGCEGDVPAMLSMALSDAVTGVSGFQANPASIDLASGEIIFAHCTIPLNMVRDYSFSTHFESGLGIGIHGEMEEGTVTILKLSGRMDRIFAREATLCSNQYKPNLCRTQVVLRVPEGAREEVLADYFLKAPIGNHHIIVPGARAEVFEAYFRSVSQM